MYYRCLDLFFFLVRKGVWTCWYLKKLKNCQNFDVFSWSYEQGDFKHKISQSISEDNTLNSGEHVESYWCEHAGMYGIEITCEQNCIESLALTHLTSTVICTRIRSDACKQNLTSYKAMGRACCRETHKLPDLCHVWCLISVSLKIDVFYFPYSFSDCSYATWRRWTSLGCHVLPEWR